MAGGDRLAPLREARRVLCVQPHYDDNDLGIGGTVAALADAGAEVHYLTATDDLVGVLDPDLPDAEATRRLRAGLAAIEQRWAADEPFSHGEALRVLRPGTLHVNLLPELV